MWKVLGAVCVLAGVAGILYNWTLEQKKKEQRLDAFLFFVRKAIFAIDTEKARIIPLFSSYDGEPQLTQILHKVAQELSLNVNPKGEKVWENIFLEEEKHLGFEPEVLQMIVQMGKGFFGRSREENITFLKKYVEEIEEQKKTISIRDKQARKIWVPLGMLGALMIIILFL